MNVVIQPQAINVTVAPGSMGVGFEHPVTRDFVERDPYTGDYTVTPSAEPQILATKNFRMTDNVTVGAIPNNYGLITWNGSTLTVS